MIDEGVARDECWTYCLWLCAVSFSKLFRKGGQVFYCAYFRNRNLGRRIIQMGVASQQVTYALICGLDELWQVLHHDAGGAYHLEAITVEPGSNHSNGTNYLDKFHFQE